ncbi:Formate nitrite transporter [Hondaea fermentalgiana]|uniref:Formate nitrite transporter n=1 Tax=Hondaea fermentalgiana TaxID=2315210 RepID=A0A2R5G8L2_9STRA|nr:Formate nitrite transporter [Hondaea fermentalgiana]|eukprot:GBG27340.1 Formate nitrite transporter [Hondaea fermentalgiana]
MEPETSSTLNMASVRGEPSSLGPGVGLATPGASGGADGVLSPQARTFAALNDKGLDRGRREFWLLFISSLYGGAYIAFGALMYARTVWEYNALVAALIFPAGLAFVITTGSDLLTSNMLYGLLPLVSGDARRSHSQKLQNLGRLLGISLLGNMIASVFVAMLAVTFEVVAAEDVIRLAVNKTSMTGATVFVKAVGANWLVNLAVYQASLVDNMGTKIILLWLPIAAFVSMKLEHSVANLTFLPAGYFAGAPLTISQILLSNLLPCLLGNFVGACVFAAQWHLKVRRPHVHKV